MVNKDGVSGTSGAARPAQAIPPHFAHRAHTVHLQRRMQHREEKLVKVSVKYGPKGRPAAGGERVGTV